MQKRILFFVALFCYSLISIAQQQLIFECAVLDAETRQPVRNAEVVFKPSNQTGITGKSGELKITDFKPGKYSITILHTSYVTMEMDIEIVASKENKFNFSLTRKVKILDEFVVMGEDREDLIISKTPYIETRFLKQQLQEEATRDIGDFLRSSKNINGIRKGGSQLDPVVRGFKYSQLNVQINNGQKIEGGCPNRMDPATAHVEIEDIESIEVKKGPYALRYGPSFGGVINMITEVPPHDDDSPIHVKAMKSYESNWNGNKEHLKVYGGYKWIFYNFSGGQKKYGNYEDGNGDEVKSEFRKFNYKGQIGFRLAKNQTVSFIYEESKGRDVRFPTLPMDERSDDTRLMSADYSAKNISDIVHTIKAKIYHTDVAHVMDNKNRPISDEVVAISTIDAVNFGGRAEAGLNLGKGILTLGFDYENIYKDGERVKNMIMQPGLPVKKEKLWNDAEIINTGVFVDYSKMVKSWEFIAAARLDFNTATSDSIAIKKQEEIFHYGKDSIETNYTNFSFSIGATNHINDNLAVSFVVGRGTRSPDMIERFITLLPVGYDKFDYLGDPKLKPETNNQADLTFKYRNAKIGNLQVNGFYSLVTDYISGKRLSKTQQLPLTTGVLGVKQFYNAGTARLRGFEIAYATPSVNNWGASLFASYTYATIDKVQQYVLDDQGEVVYDQELKNDALTEIPPFESTLSVFYRFFDGKLVPKFNLRFVAAQNHISHAAYEKETPGFNLASFSLKYNFNKYFTVIGGVNNIFNEAYFEHLNRNIIGSTNNLYEPGRSFYINLFFNL